MCGFSGFIGPTFGGDWATSILHNMGDKIYHRGPDGEGTWLDANNGLAIVHRRLSIQDLSVNGHQPMVSLGGRYIIAYNGEIYNFRTLHKELVKRGVDFRGHSDTETLLAAIEMWGIREALQKCVGMFALVLWDKKQRKLFLARDRMGEKPLYYGWQGNSFLFGSELKALKQHPDFRNDINRDALCLQLRHSTVPAPYSIYQDIFKLLPGTILELEPNSKKLSISEYWNLKMVAEQGVAESFNNDAAHALSVLDSTLSRAVSDQMISDVPLGAFLSGGIDSSMIVALMQAQSSTPVKTFTIGFHEYGYDEAHHARAVAKHLGTDHTELYINSNDLLNVIPNLSSIYDEPFSDSSQIPTYLVSSLAKQHVTVSLSGDGGDELFAGYNRHFLGKSVWNKISILPAPIRKLISSFLMRVPSKAWNGIYQVLDKILPNRYQINLPEAKIRKLAEVLSVNSPEAMYLNLVSHWKSPENIVLNSNEPLTLISDDKNRARFDDFENNMLFLDMATYLPDDILTKVDRAAMSVSLETRVPFLDHRVVELAWRIPLDLKIKNGQGKYLLRQLLYKYVPKDLMERPKMGFGVPIDSWLRGPLREWGESLLEPSRLRQEGYFNSDAIRKKWTEHISGKCNWQFQLWDVLMFQAWLENNK